MNAKTSKAAIIVFTRVPSNGYGKTRMAALLSEKERTELQQACIKDVVSIAKRTEYEVLAFCTPYSDSQSLISLIGEEIPVFPQEGDDLGQKMKNAFEAAFVRGFSPCVLIGTDIPNITGELIGSAFSILEENDVVLTPTEDGGYCLIGMSESVGSAFEKMEYGTHSVFEATKMAIERSGKTIGATATCHDLDTPEDLLNFASRGYQPHCPNASSFAERILIDASK